MSFFDTELFIVEVEKEECLWKMNSKEYMVDRYVKAKAWAKIASNMYDEWESYNKEEQELKIEELKKKWKHLRDNYTRDINETRKIQSGSEARNTKRYTYSDILSFLQPVVKKRKTTGNIETPTCSTDNAISTDEYGDERQCQLDESAAESVHEECDGSVSKQQRKKKEQITPFQKNLLHLMKNAPVHKPEDFDADKSFLLSFLPDLKKMNENQKLELKIQFMQSVKNILNPSQTLSFGHHKPNPHQFNYYQNDDYSPNLANFRNNHHQQFLPNFQTDLSHSYHSSYTSPQPSPQLHSYPGSPNVDVHHSNLSSQDENSHHTI